MKNLITKLTTLLIALTMSTTMMATNYIVSGAGTATANGTYVEDIVVNGKTSYKYEGSTPYYLFYWNGNWIINISTNVFMNRDSYYYVSSSADTPPSTGWNNGWYGGGDPPTVTAEMNTLSYNPEIFQESSANDGTIENSLTITYNEPGTDYFTDPFLQTYYSTSNIPTGLSMSITRNSNTELSVSLTGTATAHTNANDISNLEIAFNDDAFNDGDASAVTNSTKSDLGVNFIQNYYVASSGGDYTTVGAAVAVTNTKGGGDIINVAAGTYSESAEIAINTPLVITGSGVSSTTVQVSDPGNSVYRLFAINAGTGETVDISNMTIKGGNITSLSYPAYNGGGMYITSCAVNLNSVEVTGSKASRGGGIYGYESDLTISNSTISNNYTDNQGGGIYIRLLSGLSLIVSNSTISGNSIDDGVGGGISVYSPSQAEAGDAIITNSTICNNTISTGWGAGIRVDLAILTLINSTISGNSNNDTEKLYGGGLVLERVKNCEISNTILANNTISGGYNDYTWLNYITEFNSNGYNIIEYSNIAANATGGFDHATDILYNTKYNTSGTTFDDWTQGGTVLGNQDLNLSSTLTDNGGPTQTLALEAGSFAIDAGTNTGAPITDQRGYDKLDTRDIGAFEYRGWVWDGGEATRVWATAGNWDRGSMPTSQDDVTIPASLSYYPIISTSTTQTVNSLDIANGASLTVNPTSKLTVSIDLSNSGTLTLESTASGTGSLIVNGTLLNSGTMTSQCYLDGASKAWHMVSGPAVVDISNNSWNPGDNDDFYAWSEPSPGYWVNYKVTSGELNFPGVNGGDNFVAAKGYLVAYEGANPDKTFTGTLNTGDKIFTLKNSYSSKDYTYSEGWNLLGNPYSSSIDWKLVDHNDVSSLFQDDYAYAYDQTLNEGAGGYQNIDGGGVGDAYIPPHQGFFVIAKQTSNDDPFTFTNAMQTHGDGNNIYKNTNNDDALKLRLSGSNHYDETTIMLDERSTFNRDRRDALKMYSFDNAVPQLYSFSDNQIPLAVNSIPEITTENSIPLGMRVAEQGIYSISVSQNSQTIGVNGIYLEDQIQNTLHKLSDGEYSFMTESGDITNRFTIHFGIVGIDESISQAATIRTYASNNTLYILNPQQKRGTVSIYNLTGYKVAAFKLTGDTKQQQTLNLADIINIVKIQTNDEVISEKVIFR